MIVSSNSLSTFLILASFRRAPILLATLSIFHLYIGLSLRALEIISLTLPLILRISLISSGFILKGVVIIIPLDWVLAENIFPYLSERKARMYLASPSLVLFPKSEWTITKFGKTLIKISLSLGIRSFSFNLSLAMSSSFSSNSTPLMSLIALSLS
ncbi:155aa long hypothetical protein [Pyrococcus horikoshii OT3]|uniref:Uncharacterized protein n=1 Tax=Pyrococcus horikoshii (strain ATCC 700860 / DSM 12428 / JCM 9974 / NBRC 100139 / OT-3) TaxID=70601 RepID=O59057_PYRHO|nr:155aa long hypothetical protein [Pyrococcus horikoshii OT3]